MVTLTSPIAKQNIVDRFADYVVADANAGIVWGTNAKPFVEMSSTHFGGTTAGKTISITGASLGTVIDASTLYSVLVAETNLYTAIRMCQAELFVDGTGGNSGTEPIEGTIYSNTQMAYLSTAYDQVVTPTIPANGSVAGGKVFSAGLETEFFNMRASYQTASLVTQLIVTTICHASCHSSCHGARGRR
jgi:hypothetical protein